MEPARMQIAKGLRSLRERSGRTQEQVAERSTYGKASVSRYENPWSNHKIVPRAVRLLAEASDAKPQEVAALVKLAEGAGIEGWWAGNDAVPAFMNPLAQLEAVADTESVVAPSLVPGLLQTEAYARAVHEAEHVRQGPDDIDAMVTARMTRQKVLTERKPRPLNLWALLHESAVRSVVGNGAVMAEQLDHLITQAQRPNVDIQLIPFTLGASAAGVGHFVTLDAGDATAVYVELLGGGLYFDGPADVSRYRVALDYLRSQAPSPATSLDMLRAVREEYT